MKGKAVLLVMALLLITPIASAQIKLQKRSTLVPEDSLRSINPWSLQYAQNTRTGETLIVWFEWEDRDGPKTPVLSCMVIPRFPAFVDIFCLNKNFCQSWRPLTDLRQSWYIFHAN